MNKISTNNKILIIAGEDSGDLHGSSLISEMLAKNPNLEFYGVGGNKMIEAGLNAIFNIKDFSFLGITEVIKHLPFIIKSKKILLNFVKTNQIKNVILIDYPGFNLNFAKALKKHKIKVFYYISPQLWAWGQGRAKKMRTIIDRLFVLFPFEVKFFQKFGILAEFVGHPLIKRIKNYEFQPKEDFFEQYNLDINKEILLLMPGSRKHEIELIFEEILKTADILSKKYNLQIVVAASSNLSIENYSKFIQNSGIKLISNKNYELQKYSKFGIIKSGTSTLEAGLFQLPYVSVYKTSFITYLIAKLLIKMETISLVNIVAEKLIITEFIQNDLNSEKLVDFISDLLENPEKLNYLKNNLKIIEEKLDIPNSTNLAESILEGLV